MQSLDCQVRASALRAAGVVAERLHCRMLRLERLRIHVVASRSYGYRHRGSPVQGFLGELEAWLCRAAVVVAFALIDVGRLRCHRLYFQCR